MQLTTINQHKTLKCIQAACERPKTSVSSTACDADVLFFLHFSRHFTVMMIVSSLNAANDAYTKFRPSKVISLLADESEVPVFDGLDPSKHLKLYVEQESCARAISDAARQRAQQLVEFCGGWDGDGDLLVHCKCGISRSMAAAYIISCAKQPDSDEASLMSEIRHAAPHSDPCPLLVSYADELLGRDGRMLDAVEELGPPRTVIDAPVTTISIAA